MRLIDADALKEYFKTIRKYHVGKYSEWYLADVLEQQPTVDAVPVVRCKDCKHMGDVYLVSLPWLEQKEHRCRLWEHPTTPDDYCSRAERKEE